MKTKEQTQVHEKELSSPRFAGRVMLAGFEAALGVLISAEVAEKLFGAHISTPQKAGTAAAFAGAFAADKARKLYKKK